MRVAFMKAISAAACVALVVALAGCASEPEPIDRVGVNVVEKALFDGSWYMGRTVIDVDYAGSQVGTFPGDLASDAAQAFTALPRIRWVIDEDFLFAYRDYRLVMGTEPDPRGSRAPQEDDEDVYGEPVAAYAIEKHFDIRRAYNPSTGEQQNVVVENNTDRPWFEREFMRVDWSKNHLPAFFGQSADMQAVFGVWERQPADLFVQDYSQLPESWEPSFDFYSCSGSGEGEEDCPSYERDLMGEYDPGEFYHMSFVSQEIMAPGQVPDGFSGEQVNWCVAQGYLSVPACSNVVSFVRTSFIKVSDRHQYEPVNWVDSRFDRFGYFRLSQDVLDRSNGEPDDPAFGYTDFINYNVNRHNIWRQWHDEDGDPVPYADRDVRQIVWYATPELPAHLVRPSFDVIGQWNESFMGTVRHLRGEALPQYPEVECQTGDPDGYCYCQEDPQSGEIMNERCPGQYDPFTPPEDYGEDAVDPYDCWVEVPEGAEPDLEQPSLSDEDFNGWFDARFVGDECVTVLRMNTCNRASIAENDGTAEGLACEERGDLRFKFLSYVDQPGTGFLGIATLRSDPVTGEIVAGDANIGGPALDSFRTGALETYDLLNGTLDPRDIVTGENVRTYFENLGRVDLPARPRSNFTAAIESGHGDSPVVAQAREEIDNVMGRALERMERLKGADGQSQIFSDRREALIGSDIEERLMSGPEGLVMAGVDAVSSADKPELSEAALDRASPFRNNAVERLEEFRREEERLSRANVMMPNEYVDDSIQWFVNKHKDWSRARLSFGVNRLLYRQTQLHEVGHCLGLRHNFGSSADTDHYRPEYYQITERFELPAPGDYDNDGVMGLSPAEQAEFERDYRDARRYRELAGIDGAMNSSVMEYSANWYQRLQPLGRYDHAAVQFAYGDLVEAYDGPRSGNAPRDTYKWYLGGEVCERDSDCPFSESGDHAGELLESNLDMGLTQRCVQNPATDSARLCSSFDEDVVDAAESGADVAPLTYRFCSDTRANRTLAWCNRFDEGDSYREIVRNVAESYERSYIFTSFRRYRRNFTIQSYRGSLIDRRLSILQNIYNSLVYKYVLQPEFRQEVGRYGFYDQFLATTDVLNFYGSVLAQPSVGGYVYNQPTQSYRLFYRDPDADDADLSVPVGLGRYYNSDYQAGLSGIERLERIGSFIDKVYVMQMMTFRGLASNYTADVSFFTNFYDLFPNEMQQIFSGLIRGFPTAYMPRLVCPDEEDECRDPRLVYMDFYRGDCSQADTCRPNPVESTYSGLPVLDGGTSLSLQIYASLYALSEFPIYFDSTFQNQLFICIEGNGDCFEPAPNDVEGEDYVRYTSDFYRRNFLAFQVEPKENVGEQISIGFEMVTEAKNVALQLRMLDKVVNGDDRNSLDNLSEADLAQLDAVGYQISTDPQERVLEFERVRRRLSRLESFFNQMIEFQRRFGITALVLN
ncbi:MAG: zinc-dependent metalloprotease [Myxococcales bacterium]|nr:zinc-dependent metalloprotease [Myxococcales bacterium]